MFVRIFHRPSLYHSPTSALCKSLDLDCVMKTVFKTVNYIRAHALNHRQFQSFLKEVDADYDDVIYHSEVRWLSRGKVLKRFSELRKEIDYFMTTKGRPVVELSDGKWVWQLAFLADVTQHLNDLNLRLQGKGKLVNQMFYDVKSFDSKLCLFEKELSTSNLTHFKLCQIVKNDVSVTIPFPEPWAKIAIESLKEQFKRRFEDFYTYSKDILMFADPFIVDVEGLSEDLQLEIIDRQSNNDLRSKFRELSALQFYHTLPSNISPNVCALAMRMAALFGSTYICEQTFSRMKIVKSKTRSRLTDDTYMI